jgi:hypothetical protein
VNFNRSRRREVAGCWTGKLAAVDGIREALLAGIYRLALLRHLSYSFVV